MSNAFPASPPHASNPDAAAKPATRPLLGTLDIMALVVGIVIGAGIFSAPSLVAMHAGSPTAMMMAWVVGGMISVAGALCYAELASTYPHAGGDYHYLRRAFGTRLSFLFAWARLTVIPTGSIALLGYIFGDYASQIVNLGPASPAIYAAAIIVVLTLVNVAGLSTGKWTQNLLTALEVGGVVLIISVGLLFAPDAAPAAPAAPAPGVANWGLVLIFVMLTYGGWNEAAYISAEASGPGRTLPRALFWSLALITLLYLLVNLAYLNVLGQDGMGASSAVAADMMRRALGEPGAQLIALLIAISALTSANATILTAARTTYAFGQDTPAFSMLAKWHPQWNTPVNALWVQAAISLALVALGAFTRSGFATMVEYTAPVFWLFFVLSGVALFVLRRKDPGAHRPFRVPLYPLTPLLFIATSGYLFYASLRHTGVGALVGVAVLGVGALLMLTQPRGGTPPAS
ncbi:APC family permease [Pigmentiphaga kullae]|uniref:Amino acid/polyamine/organocation transporter (APC superfamily) n=1 Tax=Pigmentiphaga kullae TaxID=151784 RepID=A0A4Q7NM78_9BURK|nr:amino acid permease [Pigmentiphaga kullae]RZS86203.1 amino acid/polyamine/organocation transporter (APC superfamily) [Pigmentiphaga kullae]